MRLTSIVLLCAWLLAPPPARSDPSARCPSARCQPPRQEAIRAALWAGMDYMIGSASDPDNFEQYASDYLFFFADVERIPDAWIAERALRVGRALGEYYLAELISFDSADEVVDAASALYALDSLGMDVDPALAILQLAAAAFSAPDYLGFDPAAAELPDLDLLIDLLIGFHFTDRMGVEIGIAYPELLAYVAGVDYWVDPSLTPGVYIDLNNLVTHLVYTWTGYASWNGPAGLMRRETDYLRVHFDHALAWADPETLSEYLDSLLLVGHDPADALLAHGRALLLAIQKVDGRWEPEQVQDEYDRYHATWCAMDALRGYDLEGPDRLPDPLTRQVLEAWARQRAGQEPFDPWMPIGPARIEFE
jgi:hypothetical protein